MSAPTAAATAPAPGGARERRAFKTQDKPDEVRRSNLNAAKAVSDAVRTSLGPKGMDKMVSVESLALSMVDLRAYAWRDESAIDLLGDEACWSTRNQGSTLCFGIHITDSSGFCLHCIHRFKRRQAK